MAYNRGNKFLKELDKIHVKIHTLAYSVIIEHSAELGFSENCAEEVAGKLSVVVFKNIMLQCEKQTGYYIANKDKLKTKNGKLDLKALSTDFKIIRSLASTASTSDFLNPLQRNILSNLFQNILAPDSDKIVIQSSLDKSRGGILASQYDLYKKLQATGNFTKKNDIYNIIADEFGDKPDNVRQNIYKQIKKGKEYVAMIKPKT